MHRIREAGGGYLLIKRDDSHHFVVVADTSFSEGRKYTDLLTSNKQRYKLRDLLLDKALRLPYLSRVDFGGTWAPSNFVPEQSDEETVEEKPDTSLKFLALSYHIDEDTYIEIMEEIGGKVSDWQGWKMAVGLPEDIKVEEFEKAFRKALDKRGFHDEKVSDESYPLKLPIG